MRVEVAKDKALQPGDLVELHFNCSGPDFWKATIAAIIEDRLRDKKEFRIKSVNYLEEGKLIFTVEVLPTNPIVVTVAIIAASIVAGVVLLLIFDKAYQILETPTAQVGAIGLMVIAGLILFSLTKKAAT